MTVYLSGPMSGRENLNFPAFFEAEKRLLEMGYAVLNPARTSFELLSKKTGHTIDEGNYQRYISLFEEADRKIYMLNDIKHVLDADAIALLPGWWASRGAIVEMMVARECGKLIYEYHDGELVALKENRYETCLSHAAHIACNAMTLGYCPLIKAVIYLPDL